jgi:thiol-disulfide isomerase/thioredoxin
MRSLVLLGLIVFVSTTDQTLAQPGKQPKYPTKEWVGKTLPDFKSDFALDGDPVTLADLKGKVVLLDFWAIWCVPCRSIFPTVTRLHETYQPKGLEVVALTTYYGKYDFKAGRVSKAKRAVPPEAEQKLLGAFAKHFKMTYRIQTMPKEQFSTYKIFAIPQALLLDKTGTVRHVVVGGNPADWKVVEEKIQELLKE